MRGHVAVFKSLLSSAETDYVVNHMANVVACYGTVDMVSLIIDRLDSENIDTVALIDDLKRASAAEGRAAIFKYLYEKTESSFDSVQSLY